MDGFDVWDGGLTGIGGFGVGAEVVDCGYVQLVEGGYSSGGDFVAEGGAVEDWVGRRGGGGGGIGLGLGEEEAAEVVDAFDFDEGRGWEDGIRHFREQEVEFGGWKSHRGNDEGGLFAGGSPACYQLPSAKPPSRSSITRAMRPTNWIDRKIQYC